MFCATSLGEFGMKNLRSERSSVEIPEARIWTTILAGKGVVVNARNGG
jgi:hypothetical protein